MTDIHNIFNLLQKAYEKMERPSVTQIAEKVADDPYKVLVSTIISLRTKDEVTLAASIRLFDKAGTPAEMLNLARTEIENLIYPAGFYRNKAETILNISTVILEKYDGKVPNSIDELVKLKGVGRKTANLVMVEGFREPAVCVDVHVHRMFNRLGLLNTKNPDETEKQIREKVPQKYWIKMNEIMVAYGREICRPVSPFCSACSLAELCDKVGVVKRR